MTEKGRGSAFQGSPALTTPPLFSLQYSTPREEQPAGASTWQHHTQPGRTVIATNINGQIPHLRAKTPRGEKQEPEEPTEMLVSQKEPRADVLLGDTIFLTKYLVFC